MRSLDSSSIKAVQGDNEESTREKDDNMPRMNTSPNYMSQQLYQQGQGQQGQGQVQGQPKDPHQHQLLQENGLNCPSMGYIGNNALPSGKYGSSHDTIQVCFDSSKTFIHSLIVPVCRCAGHGGPDRVPH